MFQRAETGFANGCRAGAAALTQEQRPEGKDSRGSLGAKRSRPAPSRGRGRNSTEPLPSGQRDPSPLCGSPCGTVAVFRGWLGGEAGRSSPPGPDAARLRRGQLQHRGRRTAPRRPDRRLAPGETGAPARGPARHGHFSITADPGGQKKHLKKKIKSNPKNTNPPKKAAQLVASWLCVSRTGSSAPPEPPSGGR